MASTATLPAPLTAEEDLLLTEAVSRASDWIKKGERDLSEQILRNALTGVEFRMDLRREREA